MTSQAEEEDSEQQVYEELLKIRMENMQKIKEIKESAAYKDFHDMLTTCERNLTQPEQQALYQYEGNYLIQDAIKNPTSKTECVINELVNIDLQDDYDYKALITEIDDQKYDLKSEKAVDRIMRPDYLEHIYYPQIEYKEFTDGVLRSQLPYDVQSVLTDFSQSTQVNLRAPLLSEDASQVFKRYYKYQNEMIDLAAVSDDYIKEQRNERLIKARMEAIDATLKFLKEDQVVAQLSNEQIKPFLVEFYADPANFESIYQDANGIIYCSRSQEDEERLKAVLADIRAQAEELASSVAMQRAATGGEDEDAMPEVGLGSAAPQALGELIRDMDQETASINAGLAETQRRHSLEELEINSSMRRRAVYEAEIETLRCAEETIYRRVPPAPTKRAQSGKAALKPESRPSSARIRAILGKIQ